MTRKFYRPAALRAAAAILLASGLPLRAAARLPDTVRPLTYGVELTPDAAALRFAGRERISLTVLRPVRDIVLNAADLSIAGAELRDTLRGRPIPLRIRLDAHEQTVHLRLTRPIRPGQYRLSFEFVGNITRSGSGFFAVDGRSGREDRSLFTQLEPADARRVFPCWDEPAFKARFNLMVRVPTGLRAISNMPIASDRRIGRHLHAVRFAATPRMSTYLLFLGVGRFERHVRQADGVEVGVVTRPGTGRQADYALSAEAQLLPWLNRYFGIRFPLAKLDDVVGSGESLTYGAMENWGAIFSFEHDSLESQGDPVPQQRQKIFTTIAHEMAHQWFGNLVTMRWWDDLWLNEGFASWMEEEATRRLHPEWSSDLRHMQGRDLAMEDDALSTSHAVVRQVDDAASALQSFDFITYFKGVAVIRMIEAYVGGDAWRSGLHHYLSRSAYRNATSADLWAALQARTDRPVRQIAHDITMQPGLPMVEVSQRCVDGSSILHLEERRFRADGGARDDRRWLLPLRVGHPHQPFTSMLLREPTDLTLPGCGPTIVNIGQEAYLRTAYSPDMLSELGKSFSQLALVDQLALLSDAEALGLAEEQSPATLLELLGGLGDGSSAPIVSAGLARWAKLYALARGDVTGEALLRRFGAMTFLPYLDRLGWSPVSGETAQTENLRVQLIKALGEAQVRPVVEEARRQFARDEADRTAPSNGLRAAVLAVIGRTADDGTWAKLLAAARAAPAQHARSALLEALARTEQDELADKTLELALDDRLVGPAGPRLIEMVSTLHPAKAFAFALRHRDEILPKLDSFTAPTFFTDLADGGGDAGTLAALQAYCDQHEVPAERSGCATSREDIRNRERIRQSRMPLVYAWLRDRGYGDASTAAHSAAAAARGAAEAGVAVARQVD